VAETFLSPSGSNRFAVRVAQRNPDLAPGRSLLAEQAIQGGVLLVQEAGRSWDRRRSACSRLQRRRGSSPWPCVAARCPCATGRKPRQGEDALLVLDEFSALASGVDSAINLAERVRDVGVQVVVAAQSVEGLGDHRQAPRLLGSCAGGIVVQQCPDPERLLALAGQVPVLEHNWELDYYGPRGLAKARMGERPRIDPEAVRQAQPGEAWVIQAGQSIHLRVLPRRRWPRSRRGGGHDPTGRRHHPAAGGRGAGPGRDRRHGWPWPAGLPARLASGSAAGGSGAGDCCRRRGGRGCPCRPCPGRGRR
jgi:hypothetical protein